MAKIEQAMHTRQKLQHHHHRFPHHHHHLITKQNEILLYVNRLGAARTQTHLSLRMLLGLGGPIQRRLEDRNLLLRLLQEALGFFFLKHVEAR